MPPPDFSPSSSGENDEIISFESFAPEEEAFIPEEEEEEEGRGKRGKGRIRQKAEEKLRERGEREFDKFFEEKWGGPKGAGRGVEEIGETAAKGIGKRAAREIGEEAGEQIARGAVGAGGRAAGEAAVRAGAGAAGKAGAGAAAKAGASALGEAVGEGVAAAGAASETGPWALLIGAVTTVLSLPKSFAGALKGEYSHIESGEFTIMAVACFFVDIIFIIPSLVFVFFPIKLVPFCMVAFWITRYKGSEKPWGFWRLIWKIGASAIPLSFLPLLTLTFILEVLAHNREGEDTAFKESRQTKKKEKKEKKSGVAATAPSKAR